MREPKIFWPKEGLIAWEALMMSAICCLVAKSRPTLLHEKSLLQEMTSYLTVSWNSWCIVLKQHRNPVLRTQNSQNDYFWPKSPHVKGLNKTESEVAQLCPTLCYPMDCSLPGSSIHGIFQARILEWVAISFSRSSQPRDWTWISCIVGSRSFTIWATREDK